MAKVSVIIPTFNCSKYITEAVDSVLKQTYKDFELIIVDDGSTDNTREILEPYLKKNGKIKYIYQNNKGTAAARNTGIKSSLGKYIAFLDHDDIWLPQKTELQVSVLDSDSEIGLVYCYYQIIDEEKGVVLDSPQKEWYDGRVFEKFLVGNYIPTASQMMVRNEVFEKIGTFDESLSIVDDYDFYIRLSKYYKVKYIDKVLVKWRRHALNTSKAIDKLIMNKIMMWEKILIQLQLSKKERFIIKQRMRKDYFELGYYYISNYVLKRGRKYFVKSFKYKPLLSFIYIISSYLPISLFKTIKRIKKCFSFK